ncbi:MAG: hypothetical protein ABSC90_11895 [Acidimicrobiales bacterium]|jgi:hypothetical protein
MPSPSNRGPLERSEPEWAVRATLARASQWSSDRVLDEGDSHDKGEVSLCVGEAA